ncbi:MAG: GntR family transcriptional regulator [Betaproteobacteria bacterium]|nr:GntR family transcriptional regulator [Betaproteobacteria bacterium]NBT09691.1 GntR family transcriptional regulator [Betaproteobacteria bacterium]NBU49636.1 GntR family transcriptional regulator [Betaproteobacteria bacterium]
MNTFPLEHPNLAAQVYGQLKTEIDEFAWVPGQRRSEAEIGQRLGVSRTPVREALFRLRTEGRIDVEPKTGWFVQPIDFDRIEQLYDLRVVLERWAVGRLCERQEDPPELAELKANWLVPPSDRLSDGAAVGQLDEHFHTLLIQAAGNEEFARVHRDITERIRIVRRLDFTRADRIEATYLEHGKILRAVIQRKAEQAQLLLTSHIEHSKVQARGITLHQLQRIRPRAHAAQSRA